MKEKHTTIMHCQNYFIKLLINTHVLINYIFEIFFANQIDTTFAWQQALCIIWHCCNVEQQYPTYFAGILIEKE